MKQVTLKAVRVQEIIKILEEIPLSEFNSLKEIRQMNNLVKDLKEANKEMDELYTQVETERDKILVEMRNKFKEQVTEDTSPEDIESLTKKLDMELVKRQEEVTKPSEEKIKEASEKEITFEIGNDKYQALSAYMSSKGFKKYKDQEIFLGVADALGLE